MSSWLSWPADWLARRLTRKRAESISRALRGTSFVDAKEWARLNEISPEEAHEELERGVKVGILARAFLYEGADSPITFVVPEDRLDTPVRLSEIGDFSEEEDRDLVVSRFRSRPVYVSTGG
jgi:hypothetical protein